MNWILYLTKYPFLPFLTFDRHKLRVDPSPATILPFSHSIMSVPSPTTVYPSPSASLPIETISKSTPVPHTLTTTRSSRSITIADKWTVTSTKLPICSSSDCDDIAAKIGIPVPEMIFGKNEVRIQGPGGWTCVFGSVPALDAVDKTGSHGIKVSYSEQWNRTRFKWK
jgi:hypothetical protein